MDKYLVSVGLNGEVILPEELREVLGVVSGDVLALTVDLARAYHYLLGIS